MAADRDSTESSPATGMAQRWRERRRRFDTTFRERTIKVRANAGLAIQAGVAGGLAWFVAAGIVGNPAPFFAPIAAVVTLASSVGQRLRRTIELIIGVALGIAVGDAIILVIGTGAWQIAVVVTLAIIASIYVGGGPSLFNQAAASAVLVATLSPPEGGIYFTRFFDALIGGVVALIVMTLLIPLNPLRVVDRAVDPALETMADALSDTGGALARRDAALADAALERLRKAEGEVRTLESAIEAGRETAALAPLRWHKRGVLTRYVDSSKYISRALRDSRALVRRAVTQIQDGEPVPPPLPDAVCDLGEAARLLYNELGAGVEPQEARDRALRAVSGAAGAYSAGVGLSGSTVVAQVRSIASDLIAATGVDMAEANRMVRRAVGHTTG
ncbi:FUSC family protein [Polymorphospora sp. NPDC051019]|uniref:FUSC family protein n=1 Tax=Polymorphospora sp. NPDC051019 TaxID=3155725 RepID=UPI00342F672B